jgi:hypothetical protein
MYQGTGVIPNLFRTVIYHGTMGLAPYQGRKPGRYGQAMLRLGALLPLAVLAVVLGAMLAVVVPELWAVPAAATMLVVAYAVAVATSCQVGRDESHPLAFRALVGFLHLAGPIVRAWARSVARPAPTETTAAQSWGGDREAWLAALDRDLAGRGCRVRRGRSTDEFDLLVSAGPLLAGRLTTAVAWGWLPRHRLGIRPRLATIGAVIVGASMVAFGWWQGWVVLGVLAAAQAIEAVRLRTRIERSVRFTTQAERP